MKNVQQILECKGLPTCGCKNWQKCKNCSIQRAGKDETILPEDERERGVPADTQFLKVGVAIPIPDPSNHLELSLFSTREREEFVPFSLTQEA
jgi:hypothetical protein